MLDVVRFVSYAALVIMVSVVVTVAGGHLWKELVIRTEQVPNAQAPEVEGSSNQWVRVGPVSGSYGLFRYTDQQAGVVCYVMSDHRRAGLSCLPIDATRLGQKGLP